MAYHVLEDEIDPVMALALWTSSGINLIAWAGSAAAILRRRGMRQTTVPSFLFTSPLSIAVISMVFNHFIYWSVITSIL